MKRIVIIVTVLVCFIIVTLLLASRSKLLPFGINASDLFRISDKRDQGEVFFDTNGRFYWEFRNNGSAIEYSHSADKENWVLNEKLVTLNPNFSVGTNFSVVYFNFQKKSYAFVSVESNEGDILFFQGQIEGSKITFSPPTIVFDSLKGESRFTMPSIAIDDREDLWISAIQDFGKVEPQRFQPLVKKYGQWNGRSGRMDRISSDTIYSVGERTKTLKTARLATPDRGLHLVLSHIGNKTSVYTYSKWKWSEDYSIGNYHWLGVDSGGSIQGSVNVVTVAGNYIYVGGDFINAGGLANADGIARWDTTNNEWSALGSGIEINGSGQSVDAIMVSGKDVYIGGDFQRAGGNSAAIAIARWDSSNNSWHSLGQRNQDHIYSVNSIVEADGNLYIGGSFPDASGANEENIIRWNKRTDTWHSLASGVSDSVFALSISENKLYAGGKFTDVSGIAEADGIAVWDIDKEEWAALGQGVNGSVQSIALKGNYLYVGGSFPEVNGRAKSGCIARWDIAQENWKNLGEGFGGCETSTIALSGDDIYLGGPGFQTEEVELSMDELFGTSFVKWDSSSSGWKRIKNNPVWKINSITTLSDKIYIGGNKGRVPDSNELDTIAAFDPKKDTFSPLTQSGAVLNGMVRAIGVLGTDVYIGGDFQNAGGIEAADYIVRWNMIDRSWHALGAGVDDMVTTIKVHDQKVYIGGYFNDAKNSFSEEHFNRVHIARWNPQGEVWESFGGGLGIVPRQIAPSGDDIYVVGASDNRQFGCYGMSTDQASLQKWDSKENQWHGVLSGDFKGEISAIEIVEDSLYLGGTFLNAGGIENADNIARWDLMTGSWSALGTGTDKAVSRIVLVDGDLFVGGQFIFAGGVPNSRYIARWNIENKTWNGLPRDNDDVIWTMELFDSKLYTNAQFENSKGVKVRGFAIWDIKENSWTAFSDDINDGFIGAIAVTPSHIFIGGGGIELAGSEKTSNLVFAPINSP